VKVADYMYTAWDRITGTPIRKIAEIKKAFLGNIYKKYSKKYAFPGHNFILIGIILQATCRKRISEVREKSGGHSLLRETSSFLADQ